MISKRPTEEEISATLYSIIVQALLVDSTSIKPESRLFDDLGAESIDILDIRFRIEDSFGFKINQEHLIRSLGEDLNAAQVKERLTVASLIRYVRHRLVEEG